MRNSPLVYIVSDNAGGRHMIESNILYHRHRMKTIKPLVDNNPPWAYTHSYAKSPMKTQSQKQKQSESKQSKKKKINPVKQRKMIMESIQQAGKHRFGYNNC